MFDKPLCSPNAKYMFDIYAQFWNHKPSIVNIVYISTIYLIEKICFFIYTKNIYITLI